MIVNIKLISRPRTGKYTYWGITFGGAEVVIGVSDQDLIFARCSEKDFVENCARELLEKKGLKLQDCELIIWEMEAR